MEIENIWVVVCKECGKIYKYDNKTQLFIDDNEKPTEQYFSSIFNTSKILKNNKEVYQEMCNNCNSTDFELYCQTYE